MLILGVIGILSLTLSSEIWLVFASFFGLEIPCLCRFSAGIAGGHHAHTIFTCVVGFQTLALVFPVLRKALCSLTHINDFLRNSFRQRKHMKYVNFHTTLITLSSTSINCVCVCLCF